MLGIIKHRMQKQHMLNSCLLGPTTKYGEPTSASVSAIPIFLFQLAPQIGSYGINSLATQSGPKDKRLQNMSKVSEDERKTFSLER